MSSKTITKTTIGIQKPNALQWSPGTQPRLSKAKSSPNVSKPFSATVAKQTTKIEDKITPTARRLTTGNRSGSSKLGTPPRNTPTSKPRSNITIVQIQPECPTPATRISLVKSRNSSSDPKSTKNTTTPSPRTTKKVDPKKKSKDTPLILEDRALLKKGLLQTTPEKLPKKPEELRKKTLNRSTSLWNVEDDKIKYNSGRKSLGRECKIFDRTNSLWNVSSDSDSTTKVSRIIRTKSIAGLRPSRIPLSTQFFGLGQSLADLTLDRNAERCSQKIQDLDEVDRSMDEHIYANCQENATKEVHNVIHNEVYNEIHNDVHNEIHNEIHIYENVKSRNEPEDRRKKLSRAKSAPLQLQGSLDLERRAQELMSQLDEDDDPDFSEITPYPEDYLSEDIFQNVYRNPKDPPKDEDKNKSKGTDQHEAADRTFGTEKNNAAKTDCTKIDGIKNSGTDPNKVTSQSTGSNTATNFGTDPNRPTGRNKSTDDSKITDSKDRAKTKDTDNRNTADEGRNADKGADKLKERTSRDIKNLTNRDDFRPKQALQKTKLFAKSQECLLRKDSEMTIQEIRRNWERQIKKSQDETEIEERKSTNGKKNQFTPNDKTKRTKDIDQLVKFFNTKNTEASKEVQDSWSKIKDSGSKEKKDEKNSGYVSDGNCSEDSGHMSNENENDEAHQIGGHQNLSNLGKSKRFLEEIIQDLDHSLEHTIEVFEATPIVQRFIPAEEEKVRTLKSSLSTSSGASSIDSWDETLKVQRGSAEKGNWKKITTSSSTTTTTSSSSSSSFSKTNGVVSSPVAVVRRPQIAPKPAPLNTSSQIFFRAGALERLESQRDEKLTGHIILLQARCRGYLARRKLNTLKLQDLAVRCIQRNVRKLMSVREWPWWRLYVKIAPLLNVHRTEDQLKARQEELEILRAKVERLEQERNHLKHDNDKLEAKLSEMTADFAEEHSTSTLAAERIDAETSERLRLERELQDVTEANKNLQQATERLEMELLYARAADLNGLASDGEDGEDGGVYKQRYEHAMRELEFFKRKMAQQHEDDLEQLVGLKKQLEKKLADSYEEIEEQRQVVGQWKRRVQKLNGEMHDLRLLLEEQTARNNLLEKKQRKFDSETQNLMDDLRQEKTQRERLAREKEIAIAEKFTVEQNLSDARLEIELKEERLHTLTQELEELTFGGKTEEEVAQLKKAKHELEKKCKDQEEELDDLAGQVQLLEQAKLRLEMSIEQQRKEMRKEMQQRDEELEDVRGNAHKKVKSLEAQLENEHEERTILLREKHDLERRLVCFEEQDRTDRAAEAEMTQRLKRDLKRTKALLRDAQTMLERSKGDSTGKAALRQLKNQLEDAECARAVAVKAKQALEQDLNETQAALEEATRQRSDAEDRANAATRERAELLSQLEENEEELAEVLKKYRAAVQQVSTEQTQLQETQVQMAALEAEKSSLKDQLTELSQRLESVEQLGDPTANSLATRRLEFRTKELESKLELEQTTRARLETQIARLKESVDKLQTESALLRTKEQTAQDAARRLQRSLRESREEATSAMAREQEATRARRDVEKSLESAEAEAKVIRDDLRLALQRIDDLQSAIQGDLDLDCSEEATSENSDSD